MADETRIALADSVIPARDPADGAAALAATELVRVTRAPAIVLEEARQAARALTDVIDSKPKRVVFNGETYLEFEDWQTLGRFYGVTAKVTASTYVEYGTVRGYSARAVALRADGAEISAAEAECLTDEAKWRTRPIYEWQDKPGGGRGRMKIGDEPVPLFQLKSMAQTRACAKVLRNVLAWVVVLAGYRPTPAEEMPVERDAPATHAARPRVPKPSKSGTKTRAPIPTVYRTELRAASVEASAVHRGEQSPAIDGAVPQKDPSGNSTARETGSFAPVTIATVEARETADHRRWWHVVTAGAQELYTLDESAARELGRLAGSNAEVRLEWEIRQSGDRRRHHLLHVEPIDSGDIAF